MRMKREGNYTHLGISIDAGLKKRMRIAAIKADYPSLSAFVVETLASRVKKLEEEQNSDDR